MKRLGVLLFVLSVGFGPWIGCSRDPDQKAILDLIERIRSAAQAKEFDRLTELLSEDYRDNLNDSKAVLKDRLGRFFSEYARLEIKGSPEKVVRNGPSATVPMRLKVSGVSGDRKEWVVGSPLTAKKVEIYLEKREGSWRVVGSRIERGW